MMKLQLTARNNIKVRYYTQNKRSKTMVTAQLTDEWGINIDGAKASHTVQAGETEDMGKQAACAKALAKLDTLFGRKVSTASSDGAFDFDEAWNAMTQEERMALVAKSCESESSRKAAATYFGNNIIPKLETCIDPSAPDQQNRFAEEIYRSVLSGKNFTNNKKAESDIVKIPQAIQAIADFLTTDPKVAAYISSGASQKRVAEFLPTIQETVMKEERLRSLLESHLEDVSGNVEPLLQKVQENLTLLDHLSKLQISASKEVALEMLVFMLREFCGNEVQTKNQANGHIRNANAILENWAMKDENVPLVRLPLFDVEKAMQKELCKELPMMVQIRFAAVAMNLAAETWYAAGGMAMMVAGPRVAELCAIQLGMILDCGNYGVCLIAYTTDGEICRPGGKNAYFFRPVFFNKIAMDAINLRKNQLKSEGLTEDELKEAFLVCRKKDPFSPAAPRSFAAEIKKLLQFAGNSDIDWECVQQMMVSEPDKDHDGRPEKYDVAYVLRRNATSMMCNVAKLPPLMVDAILGHRLPRFAPNYDKQICREDMWPQIAEKLERIVYDPSHSANPLFQPIVIGSKAPIPREAVGGCTLSAPKKIRMEVSLRILNASDVIAMLPTGSLVQHNATPITGGAREFLRLAPLRSEQDYQSIIKKVQEEYPIWKG